MKKSKNTMEIFESGKYRIYLETENTGKYPCYNYYISKDGYGIITHEIGVQKCAMSREDFIEYIKTRLSSDKKYFNKEINIFDSAYID